MFTIIKSAGLTSEIHQYKNHDERTEHHPHKQLRKHDITLEHNTCYLTSHTDRDRETGIQMRASLSLLIGLWSWTCHCWTHTNTGGDADSQNNVWRLSEDTSMSAKPPSRSLLVCVTSRAVDLRSAELDADTSSTFTRFQFIQIYQLQYMLMFLKVKDLSELKLWLHRNPVHYCDYTGQF